jgi:branched-chain amino acid transport system ATP-binding protein
MLAVARALMSRPRLLLLDEPSLGLAPKLVDEVFDTVVRLRDEGVTIFLVEQNAWKALSVADRGYVMETGQIVLADDAQALMTNERVKEAYLGL